MLSQFTIRKDVQEELKSIFLQIKDTPFTQIIGAHRKKMKTEKEAEPREVRFVRQYNEIRVWSDAKIFDDDVDYFERDAQLTSNKLNLIKSSLIKIQNHKRDKEIKLLQHFKRQTQVWFYNESLRPKQSQPAPGKRTFMQPTITIKSDKKEGIQVSGTILTRDGYKITYPNIQNIMKMSSLWFEEDQQNTIIQRSFYCLKAELNPDMQEGHELKVYVWKKIQYTQFFKNVLKMSINNTEIKKVLMKVAEALGTSLNHTQLFYQISSKPWQIPGLIKEINNKNFTQRERRETLNKLMVNIQEDLQELFEEEDYSLYLPEDQHFISFERYAFKLQEMLRKRVNQ